MALVWPQAVEKSCEVDQLPSRASHLVAWTAWTQSIDLIKENDTRSWVSSSLEDLPDGPLTLSYILHKHKQTKTHSVQPAD